MDLALNSAIAPLISGANWSSAVIGAARNEEKLLGSFAGALGIAPSVVHDALAYNSIPEWDSVGHMAFVTEAEAQFEIMLDADDIVNMSSYGEIRRILRNYGVALGD